MIYQRLQGNVMSTRFNRWLGLRYLAAVLMCAIFCGSAVAGDWPQELTFKEGTVIVYQPQPEAISGNTLTGRAAMSIELADGGQPIFGVFWFSADISTDRDRDIATISRVKVTKVTWPDSKDTAEQRFTSSVENALKDGSFDASLSGLKAALAVSDKVQQSLEGHC